MGKLADLMNKKIEARVSRLVDDFSDGLVGAADHPVITGITRGNWTPSTGAPLSKDHYWGFDGAHILDAMKSGTELVTLKEAQDYARNPAFRFGDTSYWTNSLDHIGELEQRRKFFDIIVENARQAAQGGGK